MISRPRSSLHSTFHTRTQPQCVYISCLLTLTTDPEISMQCSHHRTLPATTCRNIFLVCEFWLIATSCVVFDAKFALTCDSTLSRWPFHGVAVDLFADWWLALASGMVVLTSLITVGVNHPPPWSSLRQDPLLVRRRVPHYIVYRWWLIVSLILLRFSIAVQLVSGCGYALIVIYTTIVIPLRLIEYSIVS